METQSENFFSVYGAAAWVGCSSQWIRVLLAERRLPGAFKVDGMWKIPASALNEVKQRQSPSRTGKTWVL